MERLELGSEEYLKEVRERTNSNEEYLKSAKGEYAGYTFILEAEPEKGVPEPIIIGYTVEDGKIVDIWQGQRETEFTISGPYKVWVDILAGKMSPTKALTMRKLKVKGSLIKLLKYADATVKWVEILRTIPTKFHGQYEEYSFNGK